MTRPRPPDCGEVLDLAAEHALGLTSKAQRAEVEEHLIGCAGCRHQLDEMAALGDELLGLVPDAEPPLGFDERVLARISQVKAPSRSRSRRRAGAKRAVFLAVAAVVTAVAILGGITAAGGGHKDRPGDETALSSEGRTIGTISLGGHPAWIRMKVEDASVSGSVSCELVEPGGAELLLGTFDLVKGSGSWAVPVPAGIKSVAGARLVASDGRVVGYGFFGN